MVKGKYTLYSMLHTNIILPNNVFFLHSVVEFSKRDDMKYALRVLDGGKLNGARITIEEAVSLKEEHKMT